MLKLRRIQHEPRLEIMPLIDVIFLLLTFFIYAMVLMVRVQVLPIELQTYSAASPAEPAPTATITIDRAGRLFLGREPVTLDEIPLRLEAIRENDPTTKVHLALEAGEGETDRAPLLTELLDRLRNTGLEIYFEGVAGEG